MTDFTLTKIPQIFAATALMLCSVLQTSCREWDGGTRYMRQERQMLEPAETADEWIARLELDLKNQSYSSDLLSTLYAELPPMDQWPAVCVELDKIALDDSRIAKLLRNASMAGEEKNVSEKLLIFSALLQKNDADVEPGIRNLIMVNEIREYRRDEALSILLMASKDRGATLDWLRENKPEILEKRENTHSSEKDKPAKWEKALAENEVDEGIALLEAAIAAEPDRDEKSELYHKLIRIALVLDRMPLAITATRALTDNLMAELKGDGSASSYRYKMVFTAPAAQNDWQYIVDTFRKVTALQKKDGSSHSYDFGKTDQAYATYLTAIHKLGDTGVFFREIEKAQLASKHDPENFLKLLAEITADRTPLGIFYLEHLKVSGENEKALDYALHLLARNQGTDAFYKYLVDLDIARAKTFIVSLHEYDPFEERPLIWLAEISRKEGDLENARELIDSAIALDPSDGDHGKDTRMFCYEILARIHEDSGNAGEAATFRSIVDSIRQGEAADDFLHAGLIKEATDRYKEALGQFADAYCLQSRLAMTLAKQGRFDEAVVHFKKAFELMPVSFGPRESHCFGCEGLFRDPRVIEIALPVLAAFEKENPENARAPYLLGLMLSEKDEKGQATLAYRRALEIDPDYYNAALKLLRLLEADPTDFSKAEKLRGEIFAIAPYPEKARYVPNPSELGTYWKFTADFPPSPLDLPAIPFGSPREHGKNVRQYVETERYSMYHGLRKHQALDGLSPSELRRANGFLNNLDDID